jgi:hypothetical protein
MISIYVVIIYKMYPVFPWTSYYNVQLQNIIGNRTGSFDTQEKVKRKFPTKLPQTYAYFFNIGLLNIAVHIPKTNIFSLYI